MERPWIESAIVVVAVVSARTRKILLTALGLGVAAVLACLALSSAHWRGRFKVEPGSARIREISLVRSVEEAVSGGAGAYDLRIASRPPRVYLGANAVFNGADPALLPRWVARVRMLDLETGQERGLAAGELDLSELAALGSGGGSGAFDRRSVTLPAWPLERASAPATRPGLAAEFRFRGLRLKYPSLAVGFPFSETDLYLQTGYTGSERLRIRSAEGRVLAGMSRSLANWERLAPHRARSAWLDGRYFLYEIREEDRLLVFGPFTSSRSDARP